MKVNTFSLSKSQFYILQFTFYIIFTLIFLTILSCSSPTSNPKGSLTGFVNLENQFDHSEITVAIYDLAELDPDIVYANVTWPHIGVKINQHTEFDHRFQSPIADTQTEADGSFLIPEIPVGKYNLVAKKDGWGFKYLFEVEILEGENLLADKCKIENVKCKIDDSAALGLNEIEKIQTVKNNSQHPIDQRNFHSPQTFDPSSLVFDLKNRSSDLTLYPELHIPRDIPQYYDGELGDIVIEPFHHIVINEDFHLLPNSYFELQPNSVCRIAGGKSLNIYGTVQMQGEEDGMITVTSNGIEKFFGINIYESAIIDNSRIESLLFSNTAKPFLLQKNNITFSYIYFRKSDYGLLISNQNTCHITNSQTLDIAEYGLFFETIENGAIEKSVFVRSGKGAIIKHTFNGIISNNFFSQNEFGIENWNNEVIIEYNEFERNDYDICFYPNNSLANYGITIRHNNLKSQNGIKKQWIYSFYFCSSNINFNNFYNSNLFLYCSGNSYSETVDMSNNWF